MDRKVFKLTRAVVMQAIVIEHARPTIDRSDPQPQATPSPKFSNVSKQNRKQNLPVKQRQKKPERKTVGRARYFLNYVTCVRNVTGYSTGCGRVLPADAASVWTDLDPFRFSAPQFLRSYEEKYMFTQDSWNRQAVSAARKGKWWIRIQRHNTLVEGVVE